MADEPDLTLLRRRLEAAESEVTSGRKPLPLDGGGGTSDGMNERVTRLEEWAKQADARMGRVESKLDTIILTLGGMATRSDFRNYAIGGLALGLALVAIIVGGMGWLETRAVRVTTPPAAAAPAPVIIQLPPYSTSPAPPHR